MNEDDFVHQTMLTCIGNKRKLVDNIREIVDEVRGLCGKPTLNIVDGFAGSTVVARKLSYIADTLYVNDMELYSYLMAQCFLVKPTQEQENRIVGHIETMNRLASSGPFVEGIITKLYAPKDTANIRVGERCFYTHENALIIDTLRKYIELNVEEDIRTYCLVPLLNKASIHTNTAGVFKGFYKSSGVGCFGGTGKNALSRIMGTIQLDIPIWNRDTSYNAVCYNMDINELIGQLPTNIDLMYLDPPYNEHPYGSNYFMLNLIAENKEPVAISNVSGIPADWKKSAYNKKSAAVESMKKLISDGLTKSKYLLISYNNEGIVSADTWAEIFEAYKVKKYQIDYDTYKGSRNLKERSNKVIEIMYLVSYKTT